MAEKPEASTPNFPSNWSDARSENLSEWLLCLLRATRMTDLLHWLCRGKYIKSHTFFCFLISVFLCG